MTSKIRSFINQKAILYEVPQIKKYLLNVSFESNINCNFKNEARDLLVILDKSGSMNGEPIEAAKLGIQKLIGKSVNHISKGYLIQFNHEAHIGKLQKNLVASISADGGTDFVPVFRQIRNILKDCKNDLTIVVFTDGCGSYTDKDLNLLHNDIQMLNYNCVVHTIGFSQDHDAKLLSQLTRIGTAMGTFQFIQESEDIEPAIDNIIESFLKKNVFVNLFSSNKRIAGIELEKIEDTNEFTGDLLMDEFENQTYKLQIAKENFNVTITRSKDLPIDKLLKCINLEILYLIDLISKETLLRKDLDKIREECEIFKNIMSDAKTNKLKMYPISEQRILKQSIFDIETLINEFHMNFLTSAVTNTLTNVKIASLNDLGYRIVAKRTLKLKLDKRTQDNVELFDKIDSIVEKKVKSIDFKSLNPNDFDGQCMISCMDYIEALKNSDCMCITLDIERPEAAIMDPTRVIIKNINSSMISAETFLDAIKYSLNNTDNVEACHGGFNLATNAKLFSGQSRENITGALPLFINDAHWSVAKQKMKPIMGWMCTLNILGYSYEQIATIPFSVLAKAIEDIGSGVTDFKKKVYKAVLDTCLTIYRESPSIKEELIDADGAIKFLKYPSQRTIDCTPNLSIFLVKLLCGIKIGDLNLKYSQYVLLNNYIIEEEHRRKQVFLFPVDREGTCDIDKLLYTFLGVIQEDDIEPKVKIVKQKGFEIMKEARAVIKAKKNSTNDLSDEQIAALTVLSKEGIDELVHVIESVKSDNRPRLDNKLANEALVKFDEVTHSKMGHLRLILTSYKAKHMSDLQNMDKTCINDLDDFQKLAIMAQNLHGIRNADRRYYLDKGLYIDPITDPKLLLNREFHRIVNDEIHKKCNLIRSKCVNYLSDLLRATEEFFAFSDAVALAVGEFFLSIPNFNTDDDY